MAKGFRYNNPRRQACLFSDRREFVTDNICQVGVKNKDAENHNTFLVVGDSHANSVMPLVNRLAKENDVIGLYPVYNGCPPLLYIYRSDAGNKHQCHDFNLKVLDVIKQQNIRHVLLVGRWTFYALDGVIDRTDSNGNRPKGWHKLPRLSADDSKALVTESLNDFISHIEPHVNVSILRQVPEQENEISPRYLARQLKQGVDVDKLGISLQEHLARQKFANQLIDDITAGSDRVSEIDLTPYLCANEKCAVSREGGSLYRDFNHIST